MKKCFRAGFVAADSAPEKVLTVVYERLVVDPEHEVKRMCDFLEIEWSRQMLHPANQKHLGEKAVTKKSGEVWYDSRMYNRDPESSGIDKWKTQLTLLQRITIAASFRDFEGLAQFEYDFSTESLAPIERIASSTLSAMRKFRQRYR